MAKNKDHRSDAMQDPGDLYPSPQKVLEDDNLSLNSKRKVLKNWSDEIQRLLESEAENMSPGEGSSREEELLQEITRTLDSLNGKS